MIAFLSCIWFKNMWKCFTLVDSDPDDANSIYTSIIFCQIDRCVWVCVGVYKDKEEINTAPK